MDKENLKLVVGLINTALGLIIGGWDTAIRILLLLMFTDILVGVLNALFFKTSQYGKSFSSYGLMQGAIKKGLMFAVVVVAAQIDILLNINYIRTGSIYYLIACEGISILESLIKVGVPCPDFLKKILSETKEGINNDGKIN